MEGNNIETCESDTSGSIFSNLSFEYDIIHCQNEDMSCMNLLSFIVLYVFVWKYYCCFVDK